MENPIKIDDLGVPLFLETPIWKMTLLGIHQLGISNDSHQNPPMEEVSQTSEPTSRC